MTSILFTVEGDQVFASGKGTFSIKDTVIKKQAGATAKFDGNRKCWSFPKVTLPAIKAVLDAMDVSYSETVGAPQSVQSEDDHHPEHVATLPLRRTATTRSVPSENSALQELLKTVQEMRAEIQALRTQVETLTNLLTQEDEQVDL
jgi:hypothetical protein